MPTSTIKTKSGNSHKVSYRVDGTLENLTQEQLKGAALRYLRGAARAFVVAEVNQAEPAALKNIELTQNMKQFLKASDEDIAAFAKQSGMVLEVPTTFNIPLGELIPEEGSGRGKKAADIFSMDSAEPDDDEDDVVDTTVAE